MMGHFTDNIFHFSDNIDHLTFPTPYPLLSATCYLLLANFMKGVS
jgi:hypothetical protein